MTTLVPGTEDAMEIGVYRFGDLGGGGLAEGFFEVTEGVPEAVRASIPGVLRLDTGRIVEHQLMAAEDARAWQGFVLEGSREVLRCAWTAEEIAQIDRTDRSLNAADPFCFELVEHLRAGGDLPFRTKLTGFGTATLVSPDGFVLTNRHLISGVQRAASMPDRSFVAEGVAAPHLGLVDHHGTAQGEVRLCYADEALDLAVLRCHSPSVSAVSCAMAPPPIHSRVWQIGFPHMTVRPESERAFLGYEDASFGLRYSPGLVVCHRGAEWFSDGDAAFGSSGSALLDDDGKLVGVYRGGGTRELPASPKRFRRVVDLCGLRHLPVLAPVFQA